MLPSCWELLIGIAISRRVWYRDTFYVTISWVILGGIQNENAGRCVLDVSSECYFLTSRILFPKAQEVASGVQYLHEHGVVHGDLKAVCARFVLAQ
jgi:serine/threonine protein kinase